MGVTARGYPYPEPTDPVNQGADAIKALAGKVDVQLRRTVSGILTIGQPAGNPPANNNYAFILFPAGYFTTPPAVVVTPYNRDLWATAEGVNVDNSAVVAATRSGVPWYGEVTFGWIASDVGLGSTLTGPVEAARLADLEAAVAAAGGLDAYLAALETQR